MGIVRSSSHSLIPFRTVDKTTGDIIPFEEALNQIDQLITFVQSLSQKVFDEQYDKLMDDLENAEGSSNSFGRKLGYGDFFPELPKNILAKSRIKELYLHKLISEGLGHAKLKETKQKNQGDLTMGYTINLGAVNYSMAKRELIGERIILDFKCWERELIFEFTLPSYLSARNITKLSLPVIGRKGFNFTIEERITPTANKGVCGVDLGKVSPFTMAVLNKDSSPRKMLVNSARLSKVMVKNDRLFREKKALKDKMKSYRKLKLDTDELYDNYCSVRSKNTRLNRDIAHRIGREIVDTAVRYEVGMIHLEDLRWVQGKKYGGRWNHGEQTASITHKASRAGLKVKRVNPKNTSQNCHACGVKLSHNGRKVRCVGCQTTLDRDYNAALNIAKDVNKTKSFPLANGTTGVIYSDIARVISNKQDNESINQSTKQYDKSNLSNTV